MIGNVLNIFMEQDLNDFWNKIQIYNFDPYCCLLLQIYLCCLWLLLAPGSHIRYDVSYPAVDVVFVVSGPRSRCMWTAVTPAARRRRSKICAAPSVCTTANTRAAWSTTSSCTEVSYWEEVRRKIFLLYLHCFKIQLFQSNGCTFFVSFFSHDIVGNITIHLIF